LGGAKNIHSATAVTFPGTSSAPPMETTRPNLSRTRGPFRLSSCAKFVNGPKAMYVMALEGCSAIKRRESEAALSSVKISGPTREVGLKAGRERGTFRSGCRCVMFDNPSLNFSNDGASINLEKVSRTVRESLQRLE
jgi:hypothetical protein